MRALNGFEVSGNGSLENWRKIFECWQSELIRTLNIADGLDAAFLHAEHGNTHLFAVSASLAGYGTIREVIGRRQKGDARLDLCLISSDFVELIEAKWLEFDICSTSDRPRILTKMREALNDVGKYFNNHGLFTLGPKSVRRIGISFVVPHCSSTPFEEVQVNSLLEYIRGKMAPDLMAWSFPLEARNLSYWERIYPGVIVVASELNADKLAI